MHRSGTSMIARLLHLCGVDLGPVGELRVAGPDNEQGFWENPRFVEINDGLLAQLGGGWGSAASPRPRLGEPGGPRAAPNAGRLPSGGGVRAGALGLQGSPNLPTLPFWKALIPDPRLIVCLRDPLETQRSLSRRGHYSPAFAFQLWGEYYRRLVDVAAREDRVVTHYDVILVRPRAELERARARAGLEVGGDVLERAVAAISSGLRHHRSDPAELLREHVPADVVELYGASARKRRSPWLPASRAARPGTARDPSQPSSG